MAVQITVRGRAERRWAAETATVRLAVVVQGDDRAEVAREAVEVHAALTARLAALQAAGALVRFTAQDVRVLAERPWTPDGRRADPVQTVRLAVGAVFADQEELSRFVGDWSTDARVEIADVSWDLTPEHRREREAQVRAEAVRDAVEKARTYADAIGAGPVTPTHLADPGLLWRGEAGPMPMRAAMADPGAAGPALRPDEIVLTCEVEARFVAGDDSRLAT